MFHPNQNVFILGAGANWHYGYPTGEELVEKVKATARTAINYFTTVLTSTANGIPIRPKYIKRLSSNDPPQRGLEGMRKEWEDAQNECTDLLERLITVDPLVIDYFLGQNPHLTDIGKFLIAWVILESEAVYIRDGINNNRRDLLLRTADSRDRDRATSISYIQANYKDNWYRFVLHKLVTGCSNAESLLGNKVTFITFNYDVSLEFQLFRGLSALAQLIQSAGFSMDLVLFTYTARYVKMLPLSRRHSTSTYSVGRPIPQDHNPDHLPFGLP
jgi:hypothetical protein